MRVFFARDASYDTLFWLEAILSNGIPPASPCCKFRKFFGDSNGPGRGARIQVGQSTLEVVLHAAPLCRAEQSTLEVVLHAAPDDDGRQTQDTVSKQTKKHMMRMNKKPFYTAPEAEFLDVRFEECFLESDPIKPWEPDDDPLE